MIHQINNEHPITLLPEHINYSPPRKMAISSEKMVYLIGCQSSGKPVYIQPPECTLCQSGSEWRLTLSESSLLYTNWIQQVTNWACDQIFQNVDQWFSAKLTRADISRLFVNSEESYSVNVADTVRVFDELGNYKVVTTSPVWSSANVVLELAGIICTGTQFYWHINVKQIAVDVLLDDAPPSFDRRCIVKRATTIPPVSVPDDNLLSEVEIDVPTEPDTAISLVPRNDVYYAMYKEAIQKANEARELAISSYLEARQIKDTYLLDCETDSEDEWDIDE